MVKCVVSKCKQRLTDACILALRKLRLDWRFLEKEKAAVVLCRSENKRKQPRNGGFIAEKRASARQ